MTQITTGIPANGLSTSFTFRNKIHVMSDGYRAVVYYDGTNFKLATSTNGSSWNTTTPVNGASGIITASAGLAPTGMGQRIDSCTMPALGSSLGGLYVFIIVSALSGVYCYWLPYNGGGIFGAVTTVSLLAGISPAIGAVKVTADPTATTTDSQHTAGTTGIIHCTLDFGSFHNVYPVDVHSAAFGGIKALTTPAASMSVGVPVPTYATNAILRKANTLYTVTPSGGSAGWYAYQLTWTVGGPVTTVASGTAGASATDTGYLINANATKPTAGNWYRYPSTSATSGTGPTLEGTVEPPNPSTWGYDLGTYLSGYTMPAGTWTLQLPVRCTNMGGSTVKASMRIYEQTAAGAKIFLGSINTGAGGYGLPNAGSQTVQASGSVLTGPYTFGSGSHLYVEIDLFFLAVPTGAGPYTVQKGVGNVTITTPTPTLTTTVTTSDAYSTGGIERPGLQIASISPGVVYGAALCLSDTTADPGIDIFHSNTNSTTPWVATVNRTSAGAYANYVNVPNAGPAQIMAPSAVQDAQTGDEAVYYQNSTTGHVQVIKRVGGVWGSPQQWDTSGTAVKEWCAARTPSLHGLGAAAVYLNGASAPYAMQYEDQGKVAGAVAPTATQVAVMAQFPGGWQDAIGAGSPYSVLTPTPTFSWVYNEALANDPMAAYRILITQVSGGATVNDSGWIPLTIYGSPGTKAGLAKEFVSGNTFSVTYGAWPASKNVTPSGSIAALSGGVPYNLQVQVQEKVGGLQGGKTANTYTDAVTFQYFAPPAVISVAGPAVTDVNVAPVVAYAQAGNIAAASWVFQVFDALDANTYTASGGFATPYQPGNLSTSITAGTGHNTFQADVNTLTGAVWFEPGGINAERKVISGAPSGTGPYTYTVTSDFTLSHATPQPAYAEVTIPTQYLKNVLQNGSPYAFQVQLWGAPSGYPSIFGHVAFPEAVLIPVPPTPTGLSATPIGSTSPVSGASVLLNWTTPAPGVGQAALASQNIYQQLAAQNGNAAGAWTLVKNIPATQTSVTLYSMGNAHAYNYAVAACQNEGVEAPWATVSNVTLSLTDMLRMNEAGNPALTIGLGLFSADAGQNGLPELDPVQDVDIAVPYNRTAPLVTRGTSYYYQTAQALSYMLPPGYQDAIYNQLKAWDLAKTTLQFRTGRGDVFYGVIRYCRPSYADNKNPNIQAVVIDISQVDAGTYGLLAV